MSCILNPDRWCGRRGKKHDQTLESSAGVQAMKYIDQRKLAFACYRIPSVTKLYSVGICFILWTFLLNHVPISGESLGIVSRTP